MLSKIFRHQFAPSQQLREKRERKTARAEKLFLSRRIYLR